MSLTEQSAPAAEALPAFFDEMKDAGASELRARAWAAFSKGGVPNRRNEAWHYTDLRAALATMPPLGAATGAGRVSVPKGVSILTLREALVAGDAETLRLLAPAVDDPMVALNAALMEDGVVIHVPAGAQIEEPIVLPNVASAGARSFFARSLVVLGAGARATIVEPAAPAEKSAAQDNIALVLSIAEGASLEHVAHIGPQAEGAVRVLSLIANLGAGASLHSTALVEGGGLLRRQIFATLAGDGARVSFGGASLLRGRDHADTTLVVEHAAPHGVSRERFRAIVDDEATGVFQGKVIVRPGAQKTDGVMQSKALLLSDRATMNNKPELEIYADDVACGHGATCGRLDKEQLFYMQARGLPRDEAEALLMAGFAGEAFEGASEAARALAAERITAWLAQRGGR